MTTTLGGLATYNGRQPGPMAGRRRWPDHGLEHVITEEQSMSNPWLKKNPFMSMWLSGANSVAGSARGAFTAEAKRQSTAAITQATSEMFGARTVARRSPAKRKKSRFPGV